MLRAKGISSRTILGTCAIGSSERQSGLAATGSEATGRKCLQLNGKVNSVNSGANGAKLKATEENL